MACLGIESTAHTLGIGIYDEKERKVLSNSFKTYSQMFGGMKPSDAAEHHSLNFYEVLSDSLKNAGIDKRDISLIGYSKGPGMAQCLRISRTGAVMISSLLGARVIPVHHSIAHIEIGKFECNMEDPLVIYVSGGNTQLLVKKDNRYVVLGETLDIGLGNAIDMLARGMHLEHAHGSMIEQIAKSGKYIEMPYTVKGMDAAFSGLLTKSIELLKTHPKEDVAFSFQEHAFAMLCETAERALMLTKRKEVLLCGGVAQNARLQQMVRAMCDENNVKFGVPRNEYNRDNGAMIAYTAHYLYHKYTGHYPDSEITV
ncbi:MAG: KEOPS complex N(6)-L-threonylcarbamoyladenine synthase Kae1, partial [Candidatus Micrarchaeia archaeon]